MQTKSKFKTVGDFLEKVDRPTFQSETGFSTQLVWRAKDTGTFPAHWIWKIREFCIARDMETPEHLFCGHPDAPQKDTVAMQ